MTKALKKGFTLVELIVVIAIIAILSTVSVVGYSAFMKNANQSKVDQELAQVENILMAGSYRRNCNWFNFYDFRRNNISI